MLFWLILIGFVVSVCFLHITDGDETSCVFTLVTGLLLTICLIILLFNYTNIDGEIAASNARYNAIVYQLENNIYDNDNDLGKRELYEDVMNWNTRLAWHKEGQDDFWIGIFIPNIYDQFEFIEFEEKEK